MANEPKELIELFLTGGVGTSGEGFKVKSSRLVRTVPKIHSPLRPEFFPYFFLGSVLTLPYTELNGKIGIRNSCVKITSDKTIKLAFKIEKDGKIKLVFKTITVVDEIGDRQHLAIDEFKEALGSLGLTSDKLNNCETEGEIVHIKDGELNIEELKVVEGRGGKSLSATLGEIAGSPLPRISEDKAKFKKVKKNVAVSNFDNALKNFSNIESARKGVEEFLKNLAQIYRSEKVLPQLKQREIDKRMKLADSEAAYHGFTYGVMAMNFKYKYALDIRAEPIAGKGYADLMVISRYDGGKNKRWDSPLCTFEGKRGERETAEHGVGQIKRKKYDRSQSPVRAIVKTEIGQSGAAKGRVRAGFNYSLDPGGGGVLVEDAQEFIEPKSFKELFQKSSIPKGEIERKLSDLYFSIVQSNGGGVNTNYLSRLILGELLADSSLEKHVVVYDGNEVWNSETYTKPIQMNQIMSTFVLKAQDIKYVILNVIEDKNFKIDKGIPLPEGVEYNQCIQVDITVNPEAKDGFKVEDDTGKSYYQGIEIGPPKTFQDEYKGEFKEIKHVNIPDGESKFQKQNLADALFPLRRLIIAESDFQAVIQGLLAAQAFDEKAKAEGKIVRVFTESNHPGNGKADLVFSILKNDGDGQYLEERIGLIELKYAKSQRDAETKGAEGATQIKNYEFNLKILTDLNQVVEYVIVFNSDAKSSKDLLTETEEEEIAVIHSSQEDNGPPNKKARCSEERKKRSVRKSCVDSYDEETPGEKKRKEELIKELFDTDEIKKRIENIELYNQLFKVSDEISKGVTINEDTRKALMEKIKDIDLNSIDPEIKEIVKEVKERISEEEVNKEEIRTILTRPGVTEKVGKVAESAGHALAVYFVAQHVVNGDIEGLGYDALNFVILPKAGQAVSGKLLELGVKYDSQMLKGFSPIAGSAIGNFLAFSGLIKSMKGLRDAKDPIDRKFAKLNIATNSIVIEAEVPAVATEVMSSMGVSVGVVGELVGPAGTVVSFIAVIVSHFLAAELKVEKVEESIKLIDEERTQLYWRFVLGMKAHEYIERNMEAKEIYENYMSEIIDKFKDDFNTIAMTLPYISLTREKRGTGEGVGHCLINTTIPDIKYDFGFSANVAYPFHSYTNSRVIPESIESYNVVCGPQDSNVKVQIDDHACTDCVVNGIGSGCDNLYSHSNVLLNRTLEKLSLHQYPLSCNNTVVYNDEGSDKHRIVYYMKSRSALIQSENSNITVIFDGDDISVISTKRKGDVIYSTENRCNFSQPLRKREDHILSGNVFTPEIGEVHKSGSNFFSTGNMYYFSQSLKNCKVHKPGDNFFYIKGDNFSCNLGEEGQKNIVVVQGNFTDSGNKNIHAIIGSNTTNFIEVSHAGYVDGKGGNDTITAKNSTIVGGNFGDNIYGGGVVLLPMALHDISKMIHEGDKKTIYSEDGELTIHGKEILMKTRDDFFVTATKTDSRTKMVTNLHIVNYNGTEVLEAHDDCVQESILYAVEELAFREGSKNVGFHFMHKLFNGTHLHKDTSSSVFVDSIPFIIMSALKGKFPSNPNFKTTRQMFSKKLDVVIGDYGHHVFYANKQSHFFYWEGAENLPNLYLFDDKNVTVIINKGNGLLDFSMVKSEEEYEVKVEEDAVFVVKGNVSAVLPMNYKNITVTFDQKEYYKLQGGKLERDYCSHSLKIGGKFRVNGTDLLNYNCLIFDTDEVFFLKLGNDLQLVSDKEALSILDYYKPDSDVSSRNNDISDIMRVGKFADNLDLSIKLSNRIIKPGEFGERADNPSSFKYYRPDEEGLQIYHNQPNNKNDIGLIDFKDKSILDFEVKIVKNSLVLLHRNNAIVKVENWNNYPPARKMAFAFNDTVLYNAKCIVSNCNRKDIVEEFKKEKAKLVEESTRRHRRHHIRHEHNHRGHRNHRLPIKEVTSSAARSSSWINVFANTIVDAVKGVSRFISSPFKPAIDMQPSKAMTTQSIDTNGTLLLLDVFIRKITGQKYVSTADQPMPLLEARGYALNITTEFERVLKDTAKRSGVSVNESSFNYFKTYQAVEGKMISGELSKIPTILYSAIEEAYPKNEKFLSILKSNIEKMLDGQQIVNNRNSSNQMQNTIGTSDKMPLSSLNSIAIEPLSGKKGVTCAGRVA
ncbi:PD-(D/E)XK nuclease domain-containing protein [Wolbachia endosymbiont of Oedothorax gibbosus]|uniref:PD-(D/E)XK nuclease domain-containing protein n=1 Tax=Wolbachia endosymbiont of Oedothorax gibbosus TaxID=931100 RepID=UPI002023D701|nr:PD-(D/E)XK nuclease domain-containing protein [Wolbachia endosymbiont of Oedothorax gibbosus]